MFALPEKHNIFWRKFGKQQSDKKNPQKQKQNKNWIVVRETDQLNTWDALT